MPAGDNYYLPPGDFAHVCPYCGHCPTCGRHGWLVPMQPWLAPYIQPHFVWTVTTTTAA